MIASRAVKTRPPVVTFRARDAAFGSLRAYRRESARWPYHAADMHGHKFYVLDFFDRGEGRIRLPEGPVKVAAGHVYLAPPGELHDTSGVARMGGWVVEFTGELLPASVQLALRGRRLEAAAFAVVPPGERASWSWRLDRLVSEVQNARLGSLDAARGLLQVLLVDLARLLSPEARPSDSPLSREVLAVIDRRHAEPGLSLAQVARAVGRSPSHVSAVVREQTGLTVLSLITERRMEEARRRLRETDEDVSIVAERAGYADPAYFARVFRRMHGMSARAFRKR